MFNYVLFKDQRLKVSTATWMDQSSELGTPVQSLILFARASWWSSDQHGLYHPGTLITEVAENEQMSRKLAVEWEAKASPELSLKA